MISLTEFVETKNLYFKAIYENVEYPWEVLNKIEEFIGNNSNLSGIKKAHGEVFVGENVYIDKQAEIKGPALIGRNTKIGPGGLIREGVIIGENCNIGHGSEVKHSILGNNTNVAHLNYVGDSIIGSDVNIAAGTILANYKNGARDLEVYVDLDGKKTGTGLKKFGALLGDSVKLASNVVTNPGTLIGKNTLVYPLASINGTIPANKIVKYKPQLEIVDKK